MAGSAAAFQGALDRQRAKVQKQKLAGQTQREAFTARESKLERDFSSQQSSLAFDRARSLIGPLLADQGVGGDGVDTEGLAAQEASIRRTGAQAQAKVGGALAKRNIFQSGPSAAAFATLQAETEAAVAGKAGEFAESAADRRSRLKQARLAAATQISSDFLRGAFV